MVIEQYKNAAKPLITRGINTTHQHFQMRYITLLYLKQLKSYQASKFKRVDLLSKTDITFLLWLITFEPFELKQSYIPHWKVLVCVQCLRTSMVWLHFMLHYTYQELIFLLHKIALSQQLWSQTVGAASNKCWPFPIKGSSTPTECTQLPTAVTIQKLLFEIPVAASFMWGYNSKSIFTVVESLTTY